MGLEKNPKTREIAKKLLRIEDMILGKPFPNMRRVREISNYSCAVSTLEMLLSFVGVRTSQRKLIASIRAKNKIKFYGLDVKDMAKATSIVGKKKFSFWKKANARVSDINTLILKYKFPVGVEWQGDFYDHEDEDKGHYCVVTKVDKGRGYLRMSDPYFNNYFDYNDLDRKYGINEFTKEWWDTNFVKVKGSTKLREVKDTRMMFVVTPKSETWPRKLGMIKS